MMTGLLAIPSLCSRSTAARMNRRKGNIAVTPEQTFQLQVLRAFKAGLESEKKKVDLYNRLLKLAHRIGSDENSLMIALEQSQRQVTIYEDLIKEATGKRNGRAARN